MCKNVWKNRITQLLWLFFVTYAVTLFVDAFIAQENRWFFELFLFLVSAFAGYGAGRFYENYYATRRGQKQYPTNEMFVTVLCVASVAYFLLLFFVLSSLEFSPRFSYTFIRMAVFFLYMYQGLHAKPEPLLKKKAVFGVLIPMIVSVALFTGDADRNFYANMAVLLAIGQTFLALWMVSSVRAFIKKAVQARSSKGLFLTIARALREWIDSIRQKRGLWSLSLKKALGEDRWTRRLSASMRAFLKRIYRIFRKEERVRTVRHQDYVDESFWIYADENGIERIRYRVKDLRKIQDPVKKIRYAFGLVMYDLFEKRVPIKSYDTPDMIQEKSMVIEELDRSDMGTLTDEYQKVRYSHHVPDVYLSASIEGIAITADMVIKDSRYDPKKYANIEHTFNNKDGGEDE